jgi:hypothetical protein
MAEHLREKLARTQAACDKLAHYSHWAWQMAIVTNERDRARGLAATLEAGLSQERAKVATLTAELDAERDRLETEISVLLGAVDRLASEQAAATEALQVAGVLLTRERAKVERLRAAVSKLRRSPWVASFARDLDVALAEAGLAETEAAE